jgi:hypothetical protein
MLSALKLAPKAAIAPAVVQTPLQVFCSGGEAGLLFRKEKLEPDCGSSGESKCQNDLS